MHEVGYGTDTRSVLSKHKTYFTSCSSMGVSAGICARLSTILVIVISLES